MAVPSPGVEILTFILFSAVFIDQPLPYNALLFLSVSEVVKRCSLPRFLSTANLIAARNGAHGIQTKGLSSYLRLPLSLAPKWLQV